MEWELPPPPPPPASFPPPPPSAFPELNFIQMQEFQRQINERAKNWRDNYNDFPELDTETSTDDIEIKMFNNNNDDEDESDDDESEEDNEEVKEKRKSDFQEMAEFREKINELSKGWSRNSVIGYFDDFHGYQPGESSTDDIDDKPSSPKIVPVIQDTPIRLNRSVSGPYSGDDSNITNSNVCLLPPADQSSFNHLNVPTIHVVAPKDATPPPTLNIPKAEKKYSPPPNKQMSNTPVFIAAPSDKDAVKYSPPPKPRKSNGNLQIPALRRNTLEDPTDEQMQIFGSLRRTFRPGAHDIGIQTNVARDMKVKNMCCYYCWGFIAFLVIALIICGFTTLVIYSYPYSQERIQAANGWSPWTQWSPCSIEHFQTPDEEGSTSTEPQGTPQAYTTHTDAEVHWTSDISPQSSAEPFGTSVQTNHGEDKLFTHNTETMGDFSGEDSEQFLPYRTSPDSFSKSSTVGVTTSAFAHCLDLDRSDLDGFEVTIRYGVQRRTRQCRFCRYNCDDSYIEECGGYRVETKSCMCLLNDDL